VKKWAAGAAGVIVISAALLAGSALYAGEESAVGAKKQTCEKSSFCPLKGSVSTEK
jgi:hypothetical protein